MTDIYPAPDVAFRQIKDETVLLNLKSGKYFSLDEVATRMWTLLIETHNLEITLEKLLEEYEVEREQLRADLLEFVSQLESYGLIVYQDRHEG